MKYISLDLIIAINQTIKAIHKLQKGIHNQNDVEEQINLFEKQLKEFTDNLDEIGSHIQAKIDIIMPLPDKPKEKPYTFN